MIQVNDTIDVTPICPHCSEPVEQLWCRRLKTTLGVRYIYFCGRCRKVLGVSHRKGFFMG